MRTGLTISTLLHLALLVWLFVTLPSAKIESTEAIPVDTISDTEFSQIMAGAKNGQKADAPKPIVDKVADATTQVKDPTPKVMPKPEIVPEAAATPPPEAKPPEQKPDKPEAKPDKADPQPQADEIAEALKRDEEKKKEEAKKLADQKKKEEAKKREEAKKQEKYDPAKIENRLALLDKRTPQREAATGATLNQVASLGAPTATGPTLSVSELAALQARLRDCWDVPVGVQNARDLVVTVRIQFMKDGSLAADPIVMNHSGLPLFQVAAEAAVRGIRKCAPYSFMPPSKYEVWKDVEVNFDPREMLGG